MNFTHLTRIRKIVFIVQNKSEVLELNSIIFEYNTKILNYATVHKRMCVG